MHIPPGGVKKRMAMVMTLRYLTLAAYTRVGTKMTGMMSNDSPMSHFGSTHQSEDRDDKDDDSPISHFGSRHTFTLAFQHADSLTEHLKTE